MASNWPHHQRVPGLTGKYYPQSWSWNSPSPSLLCDSESNGVAWNKTRMVKIWMNRDGIEWMHFFCCVLNYNFNHRNIHSRYMVKHCVEVCERRYIDKASSEGTITICQFQNKIPTILAVNVTHKVKHAFLLTYNFSSCSVSHGVNSIQYSRQYPEKA